MLHADNVDMDNNESANMHVELTVLQALLKFRFLHPHKGFHFRARKLRLGQFIQPPQGHTAKDRERCLGINASLSILLAILRKRW